MIIEFIHFSYERYGISIKMADTTSFTDRPMPLAQGMDIPRYLFLEALEYMIKKYPDEMSTGDRPYGSVTKFVI